ncbi:hypothetical protein A2U01_0059634, partial [Trifolium medium]|nr:hypothetical protein [Trifolium medium]
MQAARRLVSRMRVIPLPAAVGAADGVAYACNCSYNSKIPALNTKYSRLSSSSSSSLWRNKRDQKLPFIVKAG